jgi:DNA mismatch repair protein MutS2
MMQLQQKREEAEKARADALQSQHDAQRQREEYAAKLAEFERQQREAAQLREWRGKLQPGATVWVPKYDKHGRIVRVDAKRSVFVVSLGLGQWEVVFEEVFPEKASDV